MGHVVEYWSTHDFKMSDFELVGYECDESIKAVMAV